MTDTSPTSHPRLLALDVFRGLTIAGMVLVNNPGSWAAVFPPLEHAQWHGWTPTDTIFPFFVLIIGLAIPLALGHSARTHGMSAPERDWRGLYLKIGRRSLVLFGLGLFLALFPLYNWVKQSPILLADLRIMGVLQRLALCYLVSALAFLWLRPRGLAVLSGALLLVYAWVLLGPGGGDLTPSGNIVGLIDRAILTPAHIYQGTKSFDPEGLLSTLPAISGCLIGVLAGQWLASSQPIAERTAGLFFWGCMLLVLGAVWSNWLPINKQLWTPSYALFMSGMGLCVLACCLWLIDCCQIKGWTKPFEVFGANALALFVGSGLLGRLLNMVPLGQTPDGHPRPIKAAIYETVFAPIAAPEVASLLFALCFLALWLAVMWMLYAKRIFIKI